MKIEIRNIKNEANALYSLLRGKGVSHSLALAAVVEFVLGFGSVADVDASKDAETGSNEPEGSGG